MWGAPHNHEELHPICSSSTLGFSSPAVGGKGRAGKSSADKSVPNLGPCHEGLVFHKTIPAGNWVPMWDVSRAAACGLAC